MRRALAIVLVLGAAIAVAQERGDDEPARTALAAAELPAADTALPRTPQRLAGELTATIRRLRQILPSWDPSAAVPRDVTYLALHHQRILRLLARRPVGDATLALMPRDVRGEARDTVQARRDLAAIPRDTSRLPRVRVEDAAPAGELRRHYAAAQQRFGVHWSILAAVNFVESAFGRVRSASEDGARGPMQFLPSTWLAYGMGGDIDDPRDAILGAANYLQRSGAPGDNARALFAYNHSTSYVRAIRRFAARMRADERTYLTYYAWQVYVRTANGTQRLTGPGRG